MKIKITAVLAIALLVLAGCTQIDSGIQGDYSDTRWVNVYYASAEAGKRDEVIRAEQCEIPQGSLEQTVYAIYLQSCREPISNSLKSAIPQDAVLEDVSIQDGNVTLNLSREYGNISGFSRTVADYCLTMSLCELENVQDVTILINGAPSEDRNSQQLTPDDIVLADLDLVGFRKKLKLYFPDVTYSTLELELRDTVSNGTEEETLLVVKALAEGPTKSGFYSPIPYGTKINSVYMEESTCVVDFSAEFISNRQSGETQEHLGIRSIAESLFEISGIEQVQILIDGAKVQGFTHLDLSEPFSRGDI